ncbi:hypothetical protein H4R19_004141 [Coemansia spiralis]|nr:hypothetical protein H4R19_004141 [Coemansia spiralis]
MKLALASTVLFAAALAQDTGSPMPGQEASPTAAPAGMPAPTAMPSIEVIEPSVTESLLARLASFFDLSRVSSDVTSMPVFMAKVYDPVSGKFSVLASSVSRVGDAYLVPVCPVDQIAAAGLAPAMAQGATCNYGLQLTPLPSNSATAAYRVMRTLFKAILSTTMPSFMETAQPGPQVGQPGPQMTQGAPQVAQPATEAGAQMAQPAPGPAPTAQ